MKLAEIAHLSLCKRCGMHGCIVFADGTRSDMFASVEMALEQVMVALSQGKIMPPEADYLRLEIGKSKLVLESSLPTAVFSLLYKIFLESDQEGHEQAYSQLLSGAEAPPNKRTLH